MIREFDGAVLSNLLQGKQLAEVLKTDELLVIKCTNGDEIRVAWVDENGTPVKGKPAIAFFGREVIPHVGQIFTNQPEAHRHEVHQGSSDRVGRRR